MSKNTPEMPKGGGSYIRGADGKLTRGDTVRAPQDTPKTSDATPASKPAKGAK
ncbi:MAG: hypothetical protein WD046_13890 [Paracoccaceae bacterium]